MDNDTQSYFTFNEIIQLAFELPTPDDDEFLVPTKDDYLKVWIAFYNHIQEELNMDRKILVYDFFLICYERNSNFFEVDFLVKWLKNHGLKQDKKKSQIKVTRKLFMKNLEKFTDLNLEQITHCFTSIMNTIIKLIFTKEDKVDIRLQLFGLIYKRKNVVHFQSVIPKMEAKNSLKSSRGTTIGDLLRNKQILQQIQEKQRLPQALPKQFISKRNLKPLKSLLNQNQNETSQRKAQSQKLKLKPVRIKRKFDTTIFKNISKAKDINLTTHPLSLDQKYSEQLSNPLKLMQSVLKMPKKIAQPAPLIFDPYSYTLACPLNLQYNSQSISSRIAINYTPLSKYLYLDFQRKKIKILHNKENKALFIRQTTNQDKDSQDQGLALKRYTKYINENFEANNVISFPLDSLQRIFKFDSKDYKNLNEEQIAEIKKTLIEEIKRDFNFAAKKSILDYILKEDEEKIRLGIQIIPDPPIEYGKGKYKFQLKDSGEKFSVRKQNLERNMILFCDTTQKIINCWQMFENESCFDLRASKKQQMSLEEFENLQKEQLQIIRNNICSKWVKEIGQIYKIDMMEKKKSYRRRYFDCISVVISQQVRDLMVGSILEYLKFIRQFKKEKYVKVEDCLLSQKDVLAPLEKSFLLLKIKEDAGKIVFEKDIQSIQKKLIEILQNCVIASANIPRPENFFCRSDKNILQIMEMNEPVIQASIKEVETILQNNFNEISKVNIVFKEFIHLFKEKQKLVEILKGEVQIPKLLGIYKGYKDLDKRIVYEVPKFIHMNLVKIDCMSLKKRFRKIIEELKALIMDKVQSEVLNINSQIQKDIKIGLKSFQIQPESVEKLIEAEENLNKFSKVQYFKIVDNFEHLLDWFEKFFILGSQLNKEILSQIFGTKKQIQGSQKTIQKEAQVLLKKRKELEKDNQGDKDGISTSLKACELKIEQFKLEGRKFLVTQTFPEIQKQLEKYEAAEKKIEQINDDEIKLGYGKSDFLAFREVGKILRNFYSLWSMVNDWTEQIKEWKPMNIFSLDIDAIEETIDFKLKKFNKIIKEFGMMNPPPQQPSDLAVEMKKSIQAYKEDVLILKALCCKGLKQRHIVQMNDMFLSKNMNFVLDKNNVYLIENLKDSGLKNCLKELQQIADLSNKEFSNEKSLDQIEKEWQEITLELKDYKIPRSYIITGTVYDDIQTLLEEHQIKIQTMKGSKFAKIYLPRIQSIEERLNQIERSFDCWLKVQQLWIYLEPIFQSEDIMKSLPAEGNRFKRINEHFLHFMQTRKENNEILELADDPNIYKKLQEFLDGLEIIDKNLENYLDTKRQAFPRFYFLSSDSLIDILSQTKDPQQIQKYIKILFEGIATLKFNQKEEITGMQSSEGEVIPFEQLIVPNAYEKVERWLYYLEEIMIYEVKNFLLKSLNDYQNLQTEEFVLDRPGQAIVNVIMTVWTFETEDTITDNGKLGLEHYLQDYLEKLDKIIQLFETNLSKINRCGLETCIVILVHNRDIIKQLIESEVSSIEDFNYEAQMRYYRENLEQNDDLSNNEVNVKIMNTSHTYNYEYLGNSSRLVITPLTDRCYRTLCSAVFMCYGGAPEGPAGTGKTETVKDLAKSLARMIVVFNCSDKMDFKSMGRFLKGLACSGSWSCFDEFNRIELEVLSVIAQQFQKIQIALSEKKTNFQFEGSLIKIKPTCSCFITMNPGYAGRSELPDNLKALFRSVAMMVPDYAMIAEIRLFSFGFKKAGDLAKKIVTTYKLCSEQISPQKHYDYGMRAVNTTLNTAGKCKKENPQLSEDKIVLRAIIQVNKAKFLNSDLPLFEQVCRDLFPNTVLEDKIKGEFEEKLEKAIQEQNLQQTDYFNLKITQLHQTLMVRHGVMLVGHTLSGKTSSLNTLEKILEDVQKYTINPKSITSSQLYGITDIISNEWTDGVLTIKFKHLSLQNNENTKWLIFDGPVDACWIENLNTVLDDNKKLCLSNGDVFYMGKNMNMIFEVQDLEVASPATVSRCGMVYYENTQLSWMPFYLSWKNTLPETLQDFDLEKIDAFFLTIITPLFEFAYSDKIQFIQKTLKGQVVVSMLSIASQFMKIFEEKQNYDCLEFKERVGLIDLILAYSTIWSLGVLIKNEFRKTFDSNFKKFCNSCDRNIPKEHIKLHRKIQIPESGNLLDYKMSIETRERGDNKVIIEVWEKWSKFLDSDFQPQSKNINEILIQTPDNIKYKEIIKIYQDQGKHVLICGPSGTGKTVFLNSILKQLSLEKYQSLKFCFSGQTTAIQFQNNIQKKLHKRPGKYQYGPLQGKALIIYIDDLNMPKKEEYGAQPPLELLRQFIEFKGFYNLEDKDKYKMNIQDTIFLSSMTIHNSSNQITMRLLRHFNIIPFVEFNNDQMFMIYNTILSHHFQQGFEENIKNKISKITNSILDIYQKVKATFLPLPSKIHYMFNLRDITKIVKGLCQSSKQKFQETEQVFKLVAHEVWRVFGDRLNSECDRLQFLNEILKPCFNTMFGKKFDKLFSHLDKNRDNQISTLSEMRDLIYSKILTNNVIEEVLDQKKLLEIIQNSLEIYNSETDKPLNIVLFSFAVEHLLIIYRILMQQGTHALLIGTGGSGRKSLTRLSCYIGELDYFRINLGELYAKEEWQDDLKKIIKIAGNKKHIVFNFGEDQIKYDYFIEDINNLLNNGEVPNLFNPEDYGEIMEIVKAQENEDYMELFNELIKQYLHIVLNFSQIGNNFKEKVKTYPSIVNCCTVDWFFQWPEDALTSIAKFNIKNLEIDQVEQDKCIEIFKKFHFTTITTCERFNEKEGRISYCTGTLFLEILQQFQNIYFEKKKEVVDKMNTYKNGYQMIIEAEQSVEEIQQKLEKLIPELKVQNEKATVVMKEVSEEKSKADVVQVLLEKEQVKVQVKADQAKQIKDECQGEIDKIQPELDSAEEAVKLINKKDFDDIKQYKQPPKPIKYAMQCLCIILDAKIVLVQDPQTFKMVADWWTTSKKFLGTFNINQLKTFDNEKQMDDKKAAKLFKLFDDPETKEYLNEEAIQFSSKAMAQVFQWIDGQRKLYIVNKRLRPRKIELKKAEEEFNKVNSILQEKQKKLDDMNENVERLNQKLQTIQNEKAILDGDYSKFTIQAERAKKLIENLADEKTRWKELAEILEKSVDDLLGGVLLSAGYISYLGSFTSTFREELLEQWVEFVKSQDLMKEEAIFNFEKFQGKQIEIRDWVIHGLPADTFSISNAIMMSKSDYYPLFIDPQFQANHFIRVYKKEKQLKILNPKQDDLNTQIENALKFGVPVLLEDCGEELNSFLDPILLKQTFNTGAGLSIKLGDKTIEFSEDFFLYMTTKLSNPHFLPNIQTKSKIINFMVTQKGLQDQILGILVVKEKPVLEEQRQNIMVESFNNKKQLDELEKKILDILSKDKKKLLEDEKAVNVLTASKKTSNIVKKKQKSAEEAEKKINETRQIYFPVSKKLAKLFFSVNDLQKIENMYEYSLEYFLNLVNESIDDSDNSNQVET